MAGRERGEEESEMKAKNRMKRSVSLKEKTNSIQFSVRESSECLLPLGHLSCVCFLPLVNDR